MELGVISKKQESLKKSASLTLSLIAIITPPDNMNLVEKSNPLPNVKNHVLISMIIKMIATLENLFTLFLQKWKRSKPKL